MTISTDTYNLTTNKWNPLKGRNKYANTVNIMNIYYNTSLEFSNNIMFNT